MLKTTTVYLLLYFLNSITITRHWTWRRTLTQLEQVDCCPVDCLSPASFRALKAIIGALIPPINDVTEEDLLKELRDSSKYSGFNGDISGVVDTAFVNGTDKLSLKQKTHLCRGALQSDVHILVAKTFQGFLTPKVQAKLNMFLSLLENSIVCFLITGYLAPFSTLSLPDRVAALTAMRDSKIVDIRGAYQNIKRITGNLFIAYCERSSKNESWDAMSYNPKYSIKNLKDEMPSKETIKTRSIYLDSFDNGRFNNDRSKLFELNGTTVDVIVIGSGSGGTYHM